MSESLPLAFLLDVAAAAALLLWAVGLVRTGVERAFAHGLRRWLRRSGRRRVTAAATGTGAALLLQSSTAVALLVAGFLQSGALAPAVGLSMILGADLGSAVVAQLLVLRPDWVLPVLLVAGVALFLRGPARRTRDVGRILIGLALVFLSLDLLARAAGTLPAEALVPVARYLSRDPASAFLLGAALAWLMHSSVAAVLLVATAAAGGALAGTGASGMVLGANLGGALVAVGLTLGGAVEVRRIVLANLLARGGGAVAALWAVGAGLVAVPGAGPAEQALALHVLFNLVLLVAALPLAGLLLAAVGILLPAPATAAEQELSALDPAALTDPERALGCARREVLRMGEEIEAMLRAVLPLLRDWDDAVAAAIEAREARVDRMHFETKLYLARLMRDGEDDVARRASELATLAGQLEAGGDEVSTGLLGLARRVRSTGGAFSDAGWREITDFHDRVLANVQLALGVIMNPEVETARRLVAEKEAVRRVEERLQMSHLARFRSGAEDSVSTSNIHQETLRSLKQVNAAFAMAAHPTLRSAGEILSSRLRPEAAGQAAK